jgi:hypothetical protein
VLACLRGDPASRPSAREVELILRGEVDAPTRLQTRASEQPTAILRRRGSRARLVAAGVAAAVLGIGIGLGLSLGGGATGKPAPVPARVAPIPPAPTPAAAAENLARWLRAQSR